MKHVVRGVHREEGQDGVAVDEAPDRHEQIHDSEAEGIRPRRARVAPEREPDEAREDVHDVVPAVDLEDDQVTALHVRARVERGVGDEPDYADEQQRCAEGERVQLRRGSFCGHGSSVR